jgi:HD-like signal output (HDOD) protein
MQPPLVNLDKLVRDAHQLRPLPATVTRLGGLVSNPETPMQKIVEVITYDQVLTAKVLRAANAAFSAPRTPITTVQRAVVRIGTGMALSLATAASIRKQLNMSCPAYNLKEGDLWKHSVATALASDVLRAFCDHPVPQASFTAALLHDVGKLMLGRSLSKEAAEYIYECQVKHRLTRLEAEERLLKVNHSQVGGLMAKQWKFPQVIIRGIIYHHDPTPGKNPICDVVHIADYIAHRVHIIAGYTPDADGLSQGAVERLGFRVGQFDLLCERVRSRLDEVLSLYGH